MYYLYRAIFYCMYPFAIVVASIWALISPKWRNRLCQGFGFFLPKVNVHKPTVWIHAVSVGEVQVARQLVLPLQNALNCQILLTTTTFTGAQQAQRQDISDLYHCYVPYDFPQVLSRFLNHFQPLLALTVETELWPNLINACHQTQIPTILVNGRLSARSMLRYQKYSALFKPMFAQINQYIVQSDQIKQRFVQLGVSTQKIQVVHNLKYDVQQSVMDNASSIENVPQIMGHPVLIAASTHPTEEEIVLEALISLRENIDSAAMILVPRHPERAVALLALCQQLKLNAVLASEVTGSVNTTVLIVDYIGKLPAFFRQADLGIMGGSLIEHGGHNPIEAIMQNCLCLTGPNVFNFEEIYQLLLVEKACITVESAQHISDTWQTLWLDPELRQSYLQRGTQVIARLSGGSVQQHMALILAQVPKLTE